MDISLAALRLYARCPLAWFWQEQVGLQPPHPVADLVGEAMRRALKLYYSGQADRLGEAVGKVWQGWCEAWREPALAPDLMRYARERAVILAQFESGAIRNFDGELYVAPRLTARYRQLMYDRGLVSLGRKLDEFAQTRGLLLEDREGKGGRELAGSELGDAFADCLAAAGRMAQNATWPLPAREIVLGLEVTYRVDLGNGQCVSGVADVVRQASGEAGAVVLEVHDYEPRHFMRASLAQRDVRVIAALLAQPALGIREASELSWTRVERVIFRHWATGEAFAVEEGNFGHLLSVVTATARGMREHVVVPRALSGYDDCRACAYREQCWSEAGWGTVHLVDPYRLRQAEQARVAPRQPA